MTEIIEAADELLKGLAFWWRNAGRKQGFPPSRLGAAAVVSDGVTLVGVRDASGAELPQLDRMYHAFAQRALDAACEGAPVRSSTFKRWLSQHVGDVQVNGHVYRAATAHDALFYMPPGELRLGQVESYDTRLKQPCQALLVDGGGWFAVIAPIGFVNRPDNLSFPSWPEGNPDAAAA